MTDVAREIHREPDPPQAFMPVEDTAIARARRDHADGDKPGCEQTADEKNRWKIHGNHLPARKAQPKLGSPRRRTRAMQLPLSRKRSAARAPRE